MERFFGEFAAIEDKRQGEGQPDESCMPVDVSNGNGKVSPFSIRYQNKAGIERSPIRDRWAIEPDVGRVAHGVPNRVDRLKCLGNAVVPQQFYPIFRAIMEVMQDAEL